MTKKQAIKLFEEKKIRTVWDDEQESKLSRSIISPAKASDYLLPNNKEK